VEGEKGTKVTPNRFTTSGRQRSTIKFFPVDIRRPGDAGKNASRKKGKHEPGWAESIVRDTF